MKLHAVGAVLLRADRRRDGQRDVMQLIILFAILRTRHNKSKERSMCRLLPQAVNSFTLRHISWHYVKQYFFKCRPSPWVRENRLYFRAEEHFECQLLYLLSDFRHIWYSRFTGNAISCFCLCVPYQLAHKRRILFKGFNECFPYFLHILPHLEVVRYGKCIKFFSDFQLHKNDALIDIHSIA